MAHLCLKVAATRGETPLARLRGPQLQWHRVGWPWRLRRWLRLHWLRLHTAGLLGRCLLLSGARPAQAGLGWAGHAGHAAVSLGPCL